jgi:hypothetical protein
MTKIMTFTILAVLLLPTAAAFAQEGGADQQAGMEAWQKAATPGEFHQFLAKKTGSWHIETKMWMQPGAEPVTSEGSAESEMILGGRFLLEKMKGESMGMPLEGLGITGYDNTSGVVTSVWYDNFGTVTTVLTGKWEKPGAPLELHGEMFDPMTGLNMKVRTVTTFTSADESLFEYFATPPGGDEVKAMELVYTRTK